MELSLEIYNCLCATKVFQINGVTADARDFGHQGDDDPANAEEYGCGNMTFTPILPTQAVLDKYKITVEEYGKIAGELAEKLSFGSCGWCV